MSTPPNSASGAAMTRLPPSPETTSMAPQRTILPKHLSLQDDAATDSSTTSNGSNRLRSIARYGRFQPQAIACSTPLVTNCTHDDSSSAVQTSSRGDQHNSRVGTSVAAIAGPQGVALFRVSRPHTPLVVLSHASSRKSSAVSALSFEPQHTKKDDSLLLAAARGSGILVWDASGHSLSPLLGRLAMESTLSASDRITSISWKTSCSSQSLLATANATSASLWDLRTALRAHSSRPSVRLGTTRKVDNSGSVIDPLVQVAASSKNEVATLDAGGIVHVFDVRMTDRSAGNIGEVTSFSAFQHIGIGLESMSTGSEDTTSWVTWGLDATQSDAIVKVFSDRAVSGRKDSDADSYWYMDSSPTTSPKTSIAMSEASNKSGQQAQQYRQVAEFSTPHLACARVCPDPFENTIVTVGMSPGNSGGRRTRTWQAETWKLKESTDSNKSSVDAVNRGVEKIASFGVLNDKETASMVGTNASMGSLRGAELALESSQGMNGLQQNEDEDDAEGVGADLVLCCLSEKGYVTTHTVFETTSRGQKGEEASEGHESPRRSRSLGERSLVYSDRTKVFQSDGAPGRDAASMLRVTGDSGDLNDSLNQGSTLEQPSISDSPLKTDVQYFASGNDMPSDPLTEEGTATQFDMDVPVAYGAHVPGQIVNGMDVAEIASPPVVLLANDEHAIEVGLQRKDITATIDKSKVPCPRLCGGTFSPGIGGIVCFNNGDVRKMWSWYEQSDRRRRGHASVGKGRAPLQQGITSDSTVGDDSAEHGDSSVFNSKSQDLPSLRRQECPRTLKDLQDMMDHVRFSEWRSDESSGGESSLDDQSDESLDGFASGDEEEGDGDMEARKRMYEKYFGGLQESILSSPSARENKDHKVESVSPPRSPPRQKQAAAGSNTKSNEAFVGPASDLVPAVYITHDQDAIVYSGQSKELALGWMLGGWDTVDDDDEAEAASPRVLTERESSDGTLIDSFWGYEESTILPRPHSAELPVSQEKALQMSPSSAHERMQRVRSDPMLLQLAPGAPQTKNKYGVGSDDDPVHAGVHSKRPNRNESSMVFLKKLVTHQRGDTQLQSLMSPPDSPLLPNKMPFGRKKRASSVSGVMQSPSPTSIAVNEGELGDANLNAIHLGVYSLFDEHKTPRRAKLREEKLRETCIHNAEVCTSLGQVEKANVWNLLAQMAENVLQDEHDSFNGWGGAYGGSLGHDLISSVLKFYESEGDVQMLATMVCVLGGDQRKKVAEGCSLLPMSHQDRYDSFIRRYGDLLHRWRLMSKRAELRKHLERRLPDPCGNDQYSAIDITVWCSRCHQEATTDNGVCRQCGSYAFRCSLCDIAVRGMFTVCSNCGHGGHTLHLTEWFNKHSVCPTGCGCKCLLVTPMQMGDVKQGLQSTMNEGLGEALAGAGQILL